MIEASGRKSINTKESHPATSRRCGVLLHPSSLPGRFGIGDFGPWAYRFADFLAEAGQRVWQVLPLVPVGRGLSPYSSPSSSGGNPLMISPELLIEAGLLEPSSLEDLPDLPSDRVDERSVVPLKRHVLERAFDRFEKRKDLHDEFEAFRAHHAYWLEDHALFLALREAFNSDWTAWPPSLRARGPKTLAAERNKHTEAVRFHEFCQFVFEMQWQALRRYCHGLDIEIFGDLPIYVAHQSADVWAHQELFLLDDEGEPTVVAGVPPDYFSETGQNWENPIYRWERMADNGFAWWRNRFRRTVEMVDLVRLDHFRGLDAFWQIPAGEETAINGEWVPGPGDALLEALTLETGKPLPLVAEDLGIITAGVRDLMRRHDLPGMAVLQFAFDGSLDNEHLPQNFGRSLVAYTGTHDNNTFRGWFEEDASPTERAVARRHLALDQTGARPTQAAIRSVLASSAHLAIIPLQDLNELGSEARMNTPGVTNGNWTWRCRPEHFSEDVATYLQALTQKHGRD